MVKNPLYVVIFQQKHALIRTTLDSEKTILILLKVDFSTLQKISAKSIPQRASMTTSILYFSRIRNRVFSASFALLFVLFASFGIPSEHEQKREDSFVRARRSMVEKDLRGRGIKDPKVLEAMALVPRHFFVKESQHFQAYQDRALPLGEGQTISQPYVVALMTELLELKGNEKALEVGTGSGYQAAILSHLVKEVYTIEIIPSLAESARDRLSGLGYGNVQVKTGDGFFGWAEKGPFDAILVTASARKVPEPLWKQLREGGRMVMPLGETSKTQRLVRIRKIEGKRHVEDITGVIFVPMTGKAKVENH
jgi:protein-L-isoaspartate(D-aspartate) O-methyltransferase